MVKSLSFGGQTTNYILVNLQQEMRTLSAEIRRLNAEVVDAAKKNHTLITVGSNWSFYFCYALVFFPS
jgi:hypothetical protein